MNTVGITVMAILVPLGILLLFLAVMVQRGSRNFQMASAAAFFLVAAWNLGSVATRLIRGDIGMLLFIELILLIGFSLQAAWIWRVDLSEER